MLWDKDNQFFFCQFSLLAYNYDFMAIILVRNGILHCITRFFAIFFKMTAGGHLGFTNLPKRSKVTQVHPADSESRQPGAIKFNHKKYLQNFQVWSKNPVRL